MVKAKVYNQKAEAVGEQDLNPKIFGLKISPDLVHQAMVTQTANERTVLAHTKDRSEVRGGGKKPWRQKGTGRARAGSSRSPIWIGGGVTFGPTKERNFSKKLNKKMKQQALFMVLSDRAAESKLLVLDKIELADYKTRFFNEILLNLENKVIGQADKKAKGKSKITDKRSFLIVLEKRDRRLTHAGRNLAGVELINLDNINLLDVLKCRHLVMTVEGIKRLEKTFGKSEARNPKSETNSKSKTKK